MGNVGKLPHRNDMGKKDADRWDHTDKMQSPPESNEQVYDRNLRELQREEGVRTRGPQERGDADLVAGARPGVESRVRERLDTLEERGEIRGTRVEENRQSAAGREEEENEEARGE